MKTAEHNNFGILRLLLASLVVLSHAHTLSVAPLTQSIFSYVDYRVDAFFVISGHLVYGSFDKFPSLGSFYIRRLFRIYPLYMATILIQGFAVAIVAGGIIANSAELIRYLACNLMMANFLAPDLAGVFSSLQHPVINPSLWTLKIEIGFYLILPLLWYALRRTGPWLLVALYISSAAYNILALYYGADELSRQLPGQLRFFVVGIAIYQYRDAIKIPTLPAALAGIIVFALCTEYPSAPLLFVYPLCIGLLVYLSALRFPVIPLHIDFSYGVYLFHGPLIQFAILLGFFEYSPSFILMLLAVVYVLALIAERIIERPGIELGKMLSNLWYKRYPMLIGRAS